VGERAESSFNRISCTPLARVHGALHVLVLTPVGLNLPPSPMLPKPTESAPATTKGVKR